MAEVGRGPISRCPPYTKDYAEYLADVFAIQPAGQVLGVRLFSRELN